MRFILHVARKVYILHIRKYPTSNKKLFERNKRVMFFSNEINAISYSHITINGFIICANILNKSNYITKCWK